jgi:type IV secretory pathway TrbF-like protein
MMAANPYVGAWRAWDERYADPVLGKRNWQLVAGGLLLICLVLAIGMVWLASGGRECCSVMTRPDYGCAR